MWLVGLGRYEVFGWRGESPVTAVPLGPYENGPGTPCAGMMGLVKPTENTGGTKPVAHNDTVFAQVLKLVPRHEFESLARKHKSGRMSRSMTRWGQFVAMGMAQLTGRCTIPPRCWGPITSACSCATGGRRIAATTDCTKPV